jgi:hypothetical protein
MKRYLPLIAALLLAAMASPNCLAQTTHTQDVYYRYFLSEIPELTEIQIQKLENGPTKPAQLKVTHCAQKNEVLVAVDAKYPKRAADIQEEIADYLLSVLPQGNPNPAIKSIDFETANSFCK